MYTIRKRSLPTPTPKPGILKNGADSSKKSRRSVGFVDDIGKPLVEYRDLPPVERQNGTGHHHHEKTSGKLIPHREVTWKLLPVKNAPKLRNGPSGTAMIEEKRLEENGISRAPLFGTFDAFEPANLIADAIIRARAQVPIIPSDMPSYSIQSVNAIVDLPLPGGKTAATKAPGDLFSLMAQLKERGLIAGGDAPSKIPSLMEQQPKWTQGGWKIDEVCSYYVNRTNGCHRGDKCRFQHDERQRENRQKTDENWRQSSRRRHRNRNRSKSPRD